MNRGDLADLTAFVAVADQLSFRAAASRLGVTRRRPPRTRFCNIGDEFRRGQGVMQVLSSGGKFVTRHFQTFATQSGTSRHDAESLFD
jgi:hypothetical protein